MSWFSRRDKQPQDPQQIVDQMAATGVASAGVNPTGPNGPAGTVAAPAADFRLTVEDVFSITGRGTVVTGVVTAGEVAVGQEITQLRGGTALRTGRVTAIEMFRKTVDVARTGDNVGILVSGVNRGEVVRGDQLIRRAH
jgi:translation elongation factor EF-Tu-like GTPase